METSDRRLLGSIEFRRGTIARYTDRRAMSIRTALLPPVSLMREARSVSARSLGFALAATPVPVLGGAVGTFGALAGLLLFAGLLFAVERGLAADHPYPRLGAANRITLLRAGIACLIAARAVDPDPLGAPERWLLSAIAGAALLLDGADGWAARRQQMASAFGARFDMEVDAFAILVLSATVAKAELHPGGCSPSAQCAISTSPPAAFFRCCAEPSRFNPLRIGAARRSPSFRAPP